MLEAAEAVRMISAADIGVFSVPTSTYPEDKITLLRLQKFIMNKKNKYNFLEVGSYRGGALVPHLLCPQCETIFSIDSRPKSTPDERGVSFSYEEVSTQDMIRFLREHVSEIDLQKLNTYDDDASVAAPKIASQVDFAFIDGEHTVKATIRDFLSIYPCLSESSIVAFHDANLITDAIFATKIFLDHLGVVSKIFFLPKVVAIVVIGDYINEAEKAFSALAHDEVEFEANSKSALHEEFVAHRQFAKSAYEALIAKTEA